ncbi:MAG: N-acetyl sugar amidotransferase [Candidatus Omnitrophota bacterium]
MEYKTCSRCIVDSSVPGAVFDEKGECSYCKLHDKMDRQFSITGKGGKKLERLIEEMKRAGRGNKYDCVVGISGGRDSIYTLLLLKKRFGLRPLAVHFNDGFGNPVAGENMKKATKVLGIDMRAITSNWVESKDLRIAYLKASTPDFGTPTDIGIATALYGVAAKENVKHVIIGQSFRTEGIAPLEWNYLDGKYLKYISDKFGAVKLRKWKPEEPGFNLNVWHMFYYAVLRGIKVVPILYYVDYVRGKAEGEIVKELGWVNTGAHYYDDLYQSLITYILRVKFNIDRRKFNYSALIRSGQMTRQEALKRVEEVYAIEDPKVIDLCIKRLGITRREFERYMALPTKTFRDYPTSYKYIKLMRLPIKILSSMHLLPPTAYDKYFNCG